MCWSIYGDVPKPIHTSTEGAIAVFSRGAMAPHGPLGLFDGGPWPPRPPLCRRPWSRRPPVSYRSRLRSASSRRYEQPATRLKLGERGFAFTGPAAWNSLPTSFQDITDHKAFKRELKTVLFKQTFNAQSYFNYSAFMLCTIGYVTVLTAH